MTEYDGISPDDPQLTVRRVAGPQPARVVIDARGRLSAGAKMLAKDGVRRLVVTGAGAKPPLPSDIEIVGIPKTDGQIAPAAILAALAEREGVSPSYFTRLDGGPGSRSCASGSRRRNGVDEAMFTDDQPEDGQHETTFWRGSW